MKSLGVFVTVLCLLAVDAKAIRVSFADTSDTSTYFTVDWSDGFLTGPNGNYDFRSSTPAGWSFTVDRNAFPRSFLNFYFVPNPALIYFSLWWLDPTGLANTLDQYIIETPDYVKVVSQTATAITFDLDREIPSTHDTGNIIAAPDTGSTLALLSLALAPILFFHLRSRSQRSAGIRVR
ncbi:MAG TPA: hypothetical protein VJ063_20515 [Verrucomicrobiae bacterium]|nr:hypothetical protein [Verrucomicrobiae bacterium]